MEKQKNFIVLRYERVNFHAIGAIEAHGKRLGDVSHVDLAQSWQNRFLVGHENLREIVDDHIACMQHDNLDLRIASAKKRRRRRDYEELEAAKEAAGDNPQALSEVIDWPWDPKNVKPFTEGLLSASHDWFLGNNGAIDPQKVEIFCEFVQSYLDDEFGDEVIYARLDLDEKTPHVVFLVAPDHRERRTGRRMLSHAQHRLFGQEDISRLFDDDPESEVVKRKSYELLQDRVANHAAEKGLDLSRGTRRASDERIAQIIGSEVLKRENVAPAKGRELAAALTMEADQKKAEAEKRLAEAEEARGEADFLVTKAITREEKAAEQEAAAEAKVQSIEICVGAILDDELTYAPASDKTDEGLTWGENAPKEPERRSYLRDAIAPARTWLVRFAKKIWGISKREADLEQAEAEQRRRAALMAKQEQDAGRPVPYTLSIIADGASLPVSVDSFPGAWAVSQDADIADIAEKLNEMPNLKVRATWRASVDAAMLCDDAPVLRGNFWRGADLLEHISDQRGLDLETGVQDGKKAADSAAALQHTDDLSPMIKTVLVKDRQRQRARGS